jgi:biotin operon repressor
MPIDQTSLDAWRLDHEWMREERHMMTTHARDDRDRLIRVEDELHARIVQELRRCPAASSTELGRALGVIATQIWIACDTLRDTGVVVETGTQSTYAGPGRVSVWALARR